MLMSASAGRVGHLGFGTQLLGALVVTFGLDYLCTWLARDNAGIALLWPPEGLMLGLLLLGRAEHRWHYVAARAIAGCAAHLLYGDAVAVSLVFAAGGALQLGIAGVKLHRRADTLRLLGEAAALKQFLLWGVALPPLIAGASVGFALLLVQPSMAMHAGLAIWRNWTMASAMGVAIVTPLVFAVRQSEWQERLLGEDGNRNVGSLLACLATIVAVFVQPTYPLLFCNSPAPLSPICHRLG